MNSALTRQYCINQLAPQPRGEIIGIVARNHGHVARCNRSKPLCRRQPYEHLRFIDRGGALDAKAITIEQQRQVAETHSIDKTLRTLAVFGKICRIAAEENVALSEAQMSEQAFDVFDALQHAEHHDHVGPHRGFGGKFVGIQADVVRPAILAGADIAAAIRQ